MKKLLIILVLCTTLFLTAGGCGTDNDEQNDLRMEVTALTSLADSHVYDYIDLLQELVSRPDVQSAQWEQMQAALSKPLQNRIEANIFFFLPDGSSYTSDQGKTTQNLNDRDYFSKIMNGETVVGTTLVGKISGTKSYLVAVPVLKDGKVVGGLGTTPYLDQLSQTLVKEIGLENSRIFYALDGNGAVALSSDSAQILSESPNLVKEVVWQTSALTGWRFAVGKTKHE